MVFFCNTIINMMKSRSRKLLVWMAISVALVLVAVFGSTHVEPFAANLCHPGYTLNGSVCDKDCKVGFQKLGGHCVPNNFTCSTGQQFSSQGNAIGCRIEKERIDPKYSCAYGTKPATQVNLKWVTDPNMPVQSDTMCLFDKQGSKGIGQDPKMSCKQGYVLEDAGSAQPYCAKYVSNDTWMTPKKQKVLSVPVSVTQKTK
jgi:hypothetical protein